MKAIGCVMAWIAITVIIYLGGSFVAVSFDPNDWDTGGRVVACFLSAFAGIAIAVLVGIYKD